MVSRKKCSPKVPFFLLCQMFAKKQDHSVINVDVLILRSQVQLRNNPMCLTLWLVGGWTTHLKNMFVKMEVFPK